MIKEFKSKCNCGCGMDVTYRFKEYMTALNEYHVRQIGDELEFHSWARCETYNKKVGGSPGSSHKKGLAVDIKCPDNQSRAALIKGVEYLSHLFNAPMRMGIGRNYVHVDIDTDKVTAIWVYL